MDLLGVINQLIDNRINENEIYNIIGIVSDINTTERTCTVTPLEGATLYNVRFQSVISGTTGIFIQPTDNSKVLVSFLDFETSYISNVSDIEKIIINIGDFDLNIDENSLTLNFGQSSLFIEDGLIKFNDGSNDGLININDLVTKLNDIESDINTLKTNISTWIPVSMDGGAALKTLLTTWESSSLTLSQKSDIEDDTIIH